MTGPSRLVDQSMRSGGCVQLYGKVQTIQLVRRDRLQVIGAPDEKYRGEKVQLVGAQGDGESHRSRGRTQQINPDTAFIIMQFDRSLPD